MAGLPGNHLESGYGESLFYMLRIHSLYVVIQILILYPAFSKNLKLQKLAYRD